MLAIALLMLLTINAPALALPPLLERAESLDGPTLLESSHSQDDGPMAQFITPYVTVVDNGPSANRVDLVVLGDGYTAGQIDSMYSPDVEDLAVYMFTQNQQPFGHYKRFFNVHRVNVVSNQSGADVPPLGIFRDTALNASYYYDGVTERLLYVDTYLANAALSTGLAGSGITADIRVVTVNDSRYGGGGGGWAVYAGANYWGTEIALHEQGHSFGGLADEYAYVTQTWQGGEPGQPNVTASPTGNKWDRWLGYNDPYAGLIGAYEGAMYYTNGLYRPSYDSKMRNLGRPFDAVGREALILQMYQRVRPLDDWMAGSPVDPAAMWVQVVDPSVIAVDWYVDDQLVEADGGENFCLQDYGFAAGQYSVEARAYDSTGWVRLVTSLTSQSVSWSVTLTPEPSTLALLVLAAITMVRRKKR